MESNQKAEFVKNNPFIVLGVTPNDSPEMIKERADMLLRLYGGVDTPVEDRGILHSVHEASDRLSKKEEFETYKQQYFQFINPNASKKEPKKSSFAVFIILIYVILLAPIVSAHIFPSKTLVTIAAFCVLALFGALYITIKELAGVILFDYTGMWSINYGSNHAWRTFVRGMELFFVILCFIVGLLSCSGFVLLLYFAFSKTVPQTIASYTMLWVLPAVPLVLSVLYYKHKPQKHRFESTMVVVDYDNMINCERCVLERMISTLMDNDLPIGSVYSRFRKIAVFSNRFAQDLRSGIVGLATILSTILLLVGLFKLLV